MPLEVTPVPFAGQQLPYTPKFARPELEGMPGSGASGMGMGMGGGPATVAASAIIPPSPGGIAGPHRAIPALPEVGYTAPCVAPSAYGGGGGVGYPYAPSSYGGPLPPAGVGINGSRAIQHAPSAYGAGSVNGGASQYGSATLYGAPRYQIPGPALSTIQSDYSYANSLPAPRRGPAPSLFVGENVIAPKSSHQHHHHHHNHNQQHHSHSHSHSHSVQLYDDDDKASDISYYARPKAGRTRSGSVASSISDASSPRERDSHHKRSHSNDHHLHHERKASPRLQPVNNQHEHSPSSPSPLSLAAPPAPSSVNSPLSPRRTEPVRQKSYGLEKERDGEKRDRKISNLAQSEHGGHDRGCTDEERGAEERRRGDSDSGHDHGREHRHHGKDHHDHDHDHEHRHKSHTHSHSQDGHDDHDHTRQRRHMTHHRHHSHSHAHTPVQQPPMPPPSIAQSARRRALSMQFDPRPIEDPKGMYQAPQSLLGQGQGQGYMSGNMYDDGASVAGSAMTFMDGPVGGRVSQYGLPKYSHQPKPDYRRFMVQRGNADVFLD